MTRVIALMTCVALSSACGGGSGARSSGDANQSGSGGATTGSAGRADSGNSTAGSMNQAGAAGASAAGAAGSVMLPPATGTPGVWENVTPANADPALFVAPNGFGLGSIATDPVRPTDLYVGGYGSLWKSTDYGLHWSQLVTNPKLPGLALGHVLAIGGTTPPTIYYGGRSGAQHLYKSIDGGANFTLTGLIPEQPEAESLYSIVVDPHDNAHLISGLHEQDKVLESIDGGETWKFVSGSGWPSGGVSWFPFFIEMGDPAITRKTWFAIGQDGGSAVITRDGGQTWSIPPGVEKLQHPHGNSNLFQSGNSLFVAGIYGTPGNGTYRSTDLGSNWTRVTDGNGAIVWGSAKTLHEMWGWACSACGLNEGGPQYKTAAQPGETWTMGTLPAGLTWGPNSVATTSDGAHTIYVGSMWATGLWRYVEP